MNFARICFPRNIRKIGPTCAFSSAVSQPSDVSKGNEYRQSRQYFHQICDTLWNCRRGVVAAVEPKLILLDAPRLTMRYRSWTEFIEDGLLTVWVKQLLRRDVLAYIKPPARLARILQDIAKIIGAAQHDQLSARSLLPEDAERIYLLLHEMIYTVFVRSDGATFKDISAAVEALGRFSHLLDAPQDQIEHWSASIRDWMKSGRLSLHLAPFLTENAGNFTTPSIGPTSLSAFLRGLATLNCKPDDDSLRQLARCSSVLFTYDFLHTRSKAAIDYVRAWHTWRIDPEAHYVGSWSAWYKAYEKLLLQSGQTAEKPSQIVNLIQCAFLVAKDFGRIDDTTSVLPVTERRLKEFLETGQLSSARGRDILTTIEKLSKVKGEGAPIVNDQLMRQLISIAGK